MKIAVVNGSGKGESSNTIHYVKYIEKKFPAHEFNIINMAQRINKIEKDPELFHSIIEEMKKSDGIIWSYPVYFYMVNAQVKRFVELIFERAEENTFKDKYTTSITTSANFFDNTAHNYMQAVCEDMGMRYIEGTSWEMNDLLKEERRKDLTGFAGHFFSSIENKILTQRKFSQIIRKTVNYSDNSISETLKKGNKKLTLFVDATEKDTNLKNMVEVLCKIISHHVEVININEINFNGYCIGCGNCMTEGTCVHKDDFEKIFNEKTMKSDMVIYASSIKDRFLSARMKNFFDRLFVNGHRPVMAGRYGGCIISGPMSQIENLTTILEAMSQIGQLGHTGCVTDEEADGKTITEQIRSFVWKTEEMLENGWKRPRNFLGIGGHKIFRDMIYEKQNIPVFKLDHDYYKKHGLYDFPKPKPFEMLGMIAKSMKGIKPKEAMIAAFREVIDKE